VGAVACRYVSVNSTTCTPGSEFTVLTRDRHATRASEVSVANAQGGENLDGFLTLLVLTPFSVADTLESLASALFLRRSPVHVTIVREGLVSVLHPRRPADVAAELVGVFCCATDAEGNPPASAPVRIAREDWDMKLRLLFSVVAGEGG